MRRPGPALCCDASRVSIMHTENCTERNVEWTVECSQGVSRDRHAVPNVVRPIVSCERVSYWKSFLPCSDGIPGLTSPSSHTPQAAKSKLPSTRLA